MLCSKCGSEVRAGARFCEKCGASTGKGAFPAHPRGQPPDRRGVAERPKAGGGARKALLALASLVAVAALAGGYMATRPSDSPGARPGGTVAAIPSQPPADWSPFGFAASPATQTGLSSAGPTPPPDPRVASPSLPTVQPGAPSGTPAPGAGAASNPVAAPAAALEARDTAAFEATLSKKLLARVHGGLDPSGPGAQRLAAALRRASPDPVEHPFQVHLAGHAQAPTASPLRALAPIRFTIGLSVPRTMGRGGLQDHISYPDLGSELLGVGTTVRIYLPMPGEPARVVG